MLVDFHNNQTHLDKKLNLVTYKLGQLTSKVTTEVLEKGTKLPKTIMQINQKQKSKIHYDKKAESEFFVDNSALAGFTGERILYMSVRELIENSLDSCEVNHILPVIHLRLKILDPLNDLWTISCKDNGVGIPSEKVPVAVCSFLTSGKYVEKQQRGLFGVGLKMIAAFSTKDTDHPLKVWSKSEDESEFEGESGFKVEAILRAKLSPVTKNKIYDYISQTSIVNPYSIIIFETDEGKVTFKRRTEIMPNPSREVLPHPSDMDLKTLKKAILNFMNQKTTLQGILASSFQKMSTDKAKDIINRAGLSIKPADKYDEHELIKVVNICKHTKFQSPNTDHLSPIGEKILTVGMTSEYSIIQNKEATNSGSQTHLTTKILKPSLTAYSSRICVVNNRPTVVECGIAYGGDIPSFKLYRFANKIPLLYDEGSDVAREVISEVGINKMGISKKEVKEQFSNVETKSDRTVEYLPIHIFFHICSTKIPYKTAGKESIASEGDLKKYMKSCLSDLYRKVSAQIRRELKIKEDENKLRLYKHYIPFIVDAISDSIKIDSKKLSKAFQDLAEKYVSGELINITKQILQDSKDKGKVIYVDSKKNILNNGKGNEIIFSKFDTRTRVSKHKSNVKLAKINAPRKSQKKG